MAENAFNSSHDFDDDRFSREETHRMFGQPDVLSVQDYLPFIGGQLRIRPNGG